MRISVFSSGLLLIGVLGLASCKSTGYGTNDDSGEGRRFHNDTPCDDQTRDHVRRVTDEIPPCETLYVSRMEQNFVVWHTKKKHKISVTFPGESPFNHVECGEHLCVASNIIVQPDANKKYKYIVNLDEGGKIYDPNIIIRP